MSKRPWMPLWIADYLADTAHLSAVEHGAYLLLIMHYWSTGGLPDDDLLLSRIAKLTPQQWSKARTLIRPLFLEGWRHKRIEFELAEAERLSKAGRAGGIASGRSRRKSLENNEATSTIVQRSFNDQRTISEAPQPPPQKKDLFDGGGKGGDHVHKRPPRHGTVSRRGTIFIRRDSSDWDVYVADLKETQPFVEPLPNRDGGWWFPHKFEKTG